MTPNNSTAAPRIPATAILPEVTFSITSAIPYLAYIEGCAPKEEAYQELTQMLVNCFDYDHPPQLLAQVLRELNPIVLLVEGDDKEEGDYRYDVPTLTTTALDAIEARLDELTAAQ